MHVLLFNVFQVISRDLMTAIRKKRPDVYRNDLENLLLHHDNAPAHTAQETQLTLDVMGLERLPHPPYSPDLAPCDFALFPQLKSHLRGIHFDGLKEIRRECNTVLSRFSPEWFRDTFMQWVGRHERCIQAKGAYFEKE